MIEVYVCEMCKMEFTVKRGLKNHNKRFHPELFAYKCEMCGELAEDLKGLLIHVTKKHKNAEEYFNKYLSGKEKCRYEHCNEALEYNNRFSGYYCCQSHYEAQKKINNGIKLNFICQICGSGFEDVGGLQQHLTKIHKFDVIKNKEYYDKYLKIENEGCCLYCGKELNLVKNRFTEGYMKFCYNTECNVRWYNENDNRIDKMSNSLKQTHHDNPEISPLKKEYWMSKGYSETQAIEKVSERQTTFSKEICIEKYGEDDGIKKWQDRQEKWLDSMPRMNFSKISQELFWGIYKHIKDRYKNVYFASFVGGDRDDSKNREYRIKTNRSYRLLDFYIEDVNKCIEFDGTYWHGEIGRGNRTRDEDRTIEILEVNPDMKIFRVKEDDYNKDKEKVVQECIEFLN